MLVAGLVVLAFLLLVLPLLLEAQDTVRRFTHPLLYEETIRAAAAENGVEPALVAAVIRTESRFDEEVRSSRGAYGLMQILPETARFISERGSVGGDYRDPETNIRMGTWYLGYLQYRYEGDERLVLAAYNSGEGQVDEWISESGFDVARDIPFEETREYVENVLKVRKTYAELYGRELDRRSGYGPQPLKLPEPGFHTILPGQEVLRAELASHLPTRKLIELTCV